MQRAMVAILVALVATACSRSEPPSDVAVATFPASGVGREAEVVAAQLERFAQAHPEIRVERQATPDQADQRHQLYVQWLNSAAADPDVLQLDIVWAAEFANAGWILPLEPFAPELDDFVDSAIEAASWRDKLYALPWFIDVGMLYYRTDVFDRAPATQEEIPQMIQLGRVAGRAAAGKPQQGLVWQGNRYEGLVAVFVEYLGAYGGAILGPDGEVQVDAPASVAALIAMRRALERGDVPRSVLTWDEEKARFAFQNGSALMMRNWPYAIAAMRSDPQSKIGNAFAVAPIPPAPNGSPTAALGGQLLAINRHSDQPDAAYTLIRYLTAPEQMRERALEAAQFPARRSVYASDLGQALGVPAADAIAFVDAATARPVTPYYAQLSEILQIQVHRALTGDTEPGVALAEAARQLRALLGEPGS